MAFQFLCPNGHLLQGEEAYAGQQCQCPYCNTMFIIPAPPSPPSAQPSEPATTGPPPGWTEPPVQPASLSAGELAPPAWSPPQAPAEPERFPGVTIVPGPGDRSGEATSGAAVVSGPQDPPVVHVLCPNKHELETPREMLGQDAMCPYCQAVFRLRMEDTVEYRKRQEEERERREYRRGLLWMRWSIAIAAVVILGVILLIALAASM